MIKLKLNVKITIVIVLIAFLLASIAIYISYQIYSSTMDNHYKMLSSNIAKTAATQMNGDIILNYLDTMEKDEEYYRMLNILFEIKENNDCLYLYIEELRGENATYIMDADTSEFACELGEVYPIQPGVLQYMSSLEKGIPSFISNTEDFGWLVTALEPIFNSKGEVTAMVGVDLSMDDVMNDRQEYLYNVIFIMVIATIIATVILILFFGNFVVKPINQLSRAATRFISEKGSNTSTISQLDIKTGDEIQNLAESVKTMEKDINNYIEHITVVTAEKERIGAELNVAKTIQASMLPCIFPAFPDYAEFDIYATMTPAKEVGGDFYDFFLIDDDNLAIIIADVSGKGVPAALFMVITKTLIKNHAQSGKSPSEIFNLVNAQLCENNEAEMFVTSWMGIYNLKSGVLKYVNAGHNPPMIKKADNKFIFLKSLSGFVLAGIDITKYKEYEIKLSPGDILYLYTDGVTEATDSQNNLYGEERLNKILDINYDLNAEKLLFAVKNDIDNFVMKAPQFDDITMLVLMIKSCL